MQEGERGERIGMFDELKEREGEDGSVGGTVMSI